MSRVHVIAVIQAKPGRRAEVLEAFNANVPAVHAEDGCIEYGAAVDAEAGAIQTKYGEDTFVVDHGSKTRVVDFEQDADLFLIETGASGFAELELHEKRNGDLVVKYEGDQVVRIKDAEAGDFDQHDFMFG